MLFSAQNLSCIRNHKTLFKDLSFELQNGELLLIEGRNGAGKTSLLKLLIGLKRADGGAILCNGHPIAAIEGNFRQKLSWLGHKNPLKMQQTGLENLQMLAQLRPRNTTSFTDAMQRVGLGDAKHKLVKTYSAGMKRRLSLASLLLADTAIWILDEPQAALDKQGIQLFEDIAKQQLDAGGIIIMTSHHQLKLKEARITHLTLQENQHCFNQTSSAELA